MADKPDTPFVPALIVVDFQNDFCPPDGSLPVPDGRTIAPVINHLLTLPFALKVATRDHHPSNHISFHTNHPSSSTTTTTLTHPTDPTQNYTIPLWPPHCIQDTPGSALVSELNTSLLDLIIDKGENAAVEMYSAFYDPWRVEDSGLAGKMRDRGVTHAFVVGLAMDYCVRCTAVDAKGEGFETVVISDATKAVDPGEEGWGRVAGELAERGIGLVGSEGPEVGRVRALEGRKVERVW